MSAWYQRDMAMDALSADGYIPRGGSLLSLHSAPELSPNFIKFCLTQLKSKETASISNTRNVCGLCGRNINISQSVCKLCTNTNTSLIHIKTSNLNKINHHIRKGFKKLKTKTLKLIAKTSKFKAFFASKKSSCTPSCPCVKKISHFKIFPPEEDIFDFNTWLADNPHFAEDKAWVTYWHIACQIPYQPLSQYLEDICQERMSNQRQRKVAQTSLPNVRHVFRNLDTKSDLLVFGRPLGEIGRLTKGFNTYKNQTY